jgi:hypothetical protein
MQACAARAQGFSSQDIANGGLHRKHRFQQLFCCGSHLMATEPLPINGRVYRAVP